MTRIFAERAEEKRRVEHCPPRATSITDRAVENTMLLREVRQGEASAGAGASPVPFMAKDCPGRTNPSQSPHPAQPLPA